MSDPRDRGPDDLDELLGAYALDAVDDDERRQVDAYLATNARARAEVDEHREIATLLAFGGTDAPEGVWDRIAASLDERAPEPGPELAKVLPARRESALPPPAPPGRDRNRRRAWLGGLAAAAAIVLIAALSIALVRKDGSSTGQAGSITAAYDAAKADPSNKTIALTSPDGTTQATAVLQPSGTAFLDAASLPALPDDRTYQLWGVLDDGRAISFGVLGARPQIAAFGLSGPVKALAITEETAGGVVAPVKAPTIVGAVS